MLRQHADAEPELAARPARQFAGEQHAVVRHRPVRGQRQRLRLGEVAHRVQHAVAQLHLHLLRLERPQADAHLHREAAAHLHVVGRRGVHALDLHLVPVGRHPPAPPGQFLRGLQVIGAELGGPPGAGHVAPLGVLLHHAVRVEHGHQAHDRPLHAAGPLARHPARVPLVERRDDVLLDQVQERAALHLVLVREVRVLLAGADRPPVVAVVPFDPPAVEDRQVQPAVAANLHPAGAAGFERAARVVQPHVHALHQIPRDVHVVVFDEHDPLAELRLARLLDDALDQFLAAAVLRVRLAREDDLDRPVLAVEDRDQALEVAEHEVAALVRGEPAGEADGERVRVEHLVGPVHLRRRRPAPLELRLQPRAGHRDQPLAPALVRPPQLAVGDVIDPLPDGEVGRPLLPLDAQVAVVQQRDFWRQPALRVDAVGDAGDRHLGDGQVRPQVLPHTPRHAPVELAHAVGRVRQAQR